MASEPYPRFYRFGTFQLDVQSGELRRNGVKLRLPGQSFQVLLRLLERPGEVVTREKLRQQLWPADTFVDFDEGLNAAVKKLRLALGDSAENPRFVETLPRRGYRFIAPVTRVEAEEAAGAGALSAPELRPPVRASWARMLAVGAGALLLALAAAYALRPVLSPPRVLRVVQISHTGQVIPNQVVVTDGPRLYFQELIGTQRRLEYISVEGGDPVPLRKPQGDMDVDDISPDGSELLLVGVGGDENPLWRYQLPAQSLRGLGDIRAHDSGWSPDGRSLAYASGSALYLAGVDGSHPRKLLDLPGPVYCPRWSPDGQRLRFSVVTGHSAALWEASAEGSGAHRLFPEAGPVAWEFNGSWTPDGKYYVYHAVKEGTTDIWAMREAADFWHRRDATPVRLTSGPMSFYRPVPSRDGRQIFVIGLERAGELLRFDARSRRFAPFLGGRSVDHVAFSRDGKQVAFISYPDGALWSCRADATQCVQLTFAPMRPAVPSWSPDGRWIAFGTLTSPGSRAQIYVISAQGGKPEAVFPADRDEDFPSWTPDGKSVLLTLRDVAAAGIRPAVLVVDVHSRKTSTLPGSEGMTGTQWSPDGRYLLARTFAGKKLRLLDAHSGRWRDLPAKCMDYPTWSPDGKYIYANNYYDGGTAECGERGVYRLRLPDGKPEKVASLRDLPLTGVFGYWSGLAADGSPLVLHNTSRSDLYALHWEAP